jgi:CheY-like chemotaxis protein
MEAVMKSGNKEEKQTLLVVDDDPVFRDLEAQILSHAGYEVLQADGAAEALRLAGNTATIDLLLTDFRMPQTDGLELTQQFRAAHPETPVLLISGEQPPLRDYPDLFNFDIL